MPLVGWLRCLLFACFLFVNRSRRLFEVILLFREKRCKRKGRKGRTHDVYISCCRITMCLCPGTHRCWALPSPCECEGSLSMPLYIRRRTPTRVQLERYRSPWGGLDLAECRSGQRLNTCMRCGYAVVYVCCGVKSEWLSRVSVALFGWKRGETWTKEVELQDRLV